jgi:hypothetical protein
MKAILTIDTEQDNDTTRLIVEFELGRHSLDAQGNAYNRLLAAINEGVPVINKHGQLNRMEYLYAASKIFVVKKAR